MSVTWAEMEESVIRRRRTHRVGLLNTKCEFQGFLDNPASNPDTRNRTETPSSALTPSLADYSRHPVVTVNELNRPTTSCSCGLSLTSTLHKTRPRGRRSRKLGLARGELDRAKRKDQEL